MTVLVLDTSFTDTTLTDTSTSGAMKIDGATSVGFQAAVTVNTPAASTFLSGVSDVDTITFTTKAGTANGDYVVVYDQSGGTWACFADKSTPEAGTITFQNKVGTASKDHLVMYDQSGQGWSIYNDVTGSDGAPSGAIYTALAAGKKGSAVTTTDTTAANVAARFVAAFNALTGFTAVITLTDNLDGTVAYALATRGLATDSAPYNNAEGGAGSIAVSVTTQGIATPTPTGAAYVAVASANKSRCDISADSTAAQVAARFELAFNALTGFTAIITTDDSAADGTMLFTQVVRGVTTASVPHNTGDTGAGSISVAQTTAGVASAVNITTDTITKVAHGLPTGLKGQLTTTGTLPTGVTTGTDYFIISLTANTYAFASSLANAEAGTKIDLTSQGASGNTHTFTATAIAGATLTLQYSMNDASLVAGVWTNVASATSITVTANLPILISSPAYKYIRYVYAITAGSMTVISYIRAVNSGLNHE